MEKPHPGADCLNMLAAMVLQEVAAHPDLAAPIRAAFMGTAVDLAKHAAHCAVAESETAQLFERIGRSGGAAA